MRVDGRGGFAVVETGEPAPSPAGPALSATPTPLLPDFEALRAVGYRRRHRHRHRHRRAPLRLDRQRSAGRCQRRAHRARSTRGRAPYLWPLMDPLALVFSSGWASGVNAYLVVLVLGIADRVNDLAQIPDVLGRSDVLAVAVLFAMEFVADKIPYIDSTWDAISTAIRPTVGAVIGVLLAGEAATLEQAMSAWSAAAPPWPRTREGREPAGDQLLPRAGHQHRRQLAEDVAVLGVVWVAIEHPVAAASIAAVLLVAGWRCSTSCSRWCVAACDGGDGAARARRRTPEVRARDSGPAAPLRELPGRCPEDQPEDNGAQSVTTAFRTSTFGGRPGRADGGQHTGDCGQRDVQRDLRTGDRDTGDPLVLQRLRQRQPDADPEPGATHGTDQRDHHGLPADHGPDLAAGHADRTEQAQLPGALEDRERQGVDDAEQGDHDRQQEHHGDEQQQVVDEATGLRLEPSWSRTLASGWSARAAEMASLTSPRSAPSAIRTRPETTS